VEPLPEVQSGQYGYEIISKEGVWGIEILADNSFMHLGLATAPFDIDGWGAPQMARKKRFESLST
jgi:hypothetical protein